MEQVQNYADDRLINGCIYCGDPADTRDHVPSRILLDAPFPENLPVVGACWPCNNGFSQDEEYLACLIEVAVAGSTDPDRIRRLAVAKILRRSPALRAKLDAAQISKEGRIYLNVESERVKNVLLKLARGHAAFELSQLCREEPSSLWWCALALMSEGQLDSFNASHVVEMLGEIGSRQSQRLLVTQFVFQSEDSEQSALGLLINDWIDVQDSRYRYLAIDDGDQIRIKIVIAEYLACEVVWNREYEETEHIGNPTKAA